MNGVDRPPEGGREPTWSAAAWNTPDTRRRARQRVEPRLTQVNRPRLGWEAGPVEDKGTLLGPSMRSRVVASARWRRVIACSRSWPRRRRVDFQVPSGSRKRRSRTTVVNTCP